MHRVSESPSDPPSARRPDRRRVRVGRVSIDALTFDQALDAIAALVADGKGGAVYTPNVDHVVMVNHDERFRSAYDSVDLSLADGMPILWAARLLGSPLPAKISGSDLMLPLVERAAREGWRVYLLGGGPGVAEKAAEKLVARFPSLVVAGTDAPMLNMDAPAATRAPVVERIRAARPDVVLVCLGAPKQELFIREIASRVRPAVLLGVGAAIDFVAGTARRAPRWMSETGLEWLYRLAQEPRRMWKRYLVRDPEFALIVLRDLLR